MEFNKKNSERKNITKSEIWLPHDYIRITQNKEKMKKATEFLEKYKIWFSTVLSFALTCAAIMVSIASYNINKYQVQLNEQSINNLNQEKHPYFSIENKYDEDSGEYTYIIRNTGGDVRYSNIYLFSYLYIDRRLEGQYEPLEYAFIELPGLYRNSEIELSEDILFAFKDYKFYNQVSKEFILADDLFRSYSCWDNLGGMDTSVFSEIIYNLQVSYVNYKNEYKVEVITFSRSSDLSKRTEGNTILNIDMSERFFINSTTPKYKIDSLNLTDKEIMKESEELIENLRQEFGQTEAAEIYREENRHGR